MYHEVVGDGDTTMLFVHGGFCTSAVWRHQVASLSKETGRVITVDLPGHGQSPIADPTSISIERCAEEVIELVEANRYGPCILVGHSFACRVVLEAARQMSTVRGIILVDTSRVAAQGQPVNDNVIGDTIRQIGGRRFLQRYFDDMLIGANSHTIRPEALTNLESIDDRMIAPLMSSAVRWDADVMDQTIEELSNCNMLAVQSTSNHLGAQRTKVNSARVPWLDYLKGRLECLQIVTIQDAGHLCMLERPDEVTAAMKEFVRTLL